MRDYCLNKRGESNNKVDSFDRFDKQNKNLHKQLKKFMCVGKLDLILTCSQMKKIQSN